MSYHVFFGFSTGLAHALRVPLGTRQALIGHVEAIEARLDLKRTRYEDNPLHWDRSGMEKIADEIVCDAVETHNAWVRRVYAQFEAWARSPVPDGEVLTPQAAEAFWHGLEILSVDPSRWTAEYYRARMASLYEVMRGREDAGVTLDAKALTPRQAAAVIRLFAEFLDRNDLRLDVPAGHDHLAALQDGGYDWCERCGQPKTIEDGLACRRRKCPLAAQDADACA